MYRCKMLEDSRKVFFRTKDGITFHRSESNRPLHAQNSDSSLRKEGKFRMLNHIFSKKKKELHPSQQTDLSQECQLKEETSEVDDIITMFECVTEPRDESENSSTVRKRNNESEKVHLGEDTSSKDLQSLPPIRTQSLPPITLGKSLLVNSQTLAHRTSGAHVAGHLAHRSQKSKSEHDLFDGKSKDQKAAGSSQILTHKAWISTPSERLLDKLLHGSSSPLDVLCSNHTPYIQRNDQGEILRTDR